MSQLRLSGGRGGGGLLGCWARASAGSSSIAAAAVPSQLVALCRGVHSHTPVRVAAVFGGDDIHTAPSASTASAAPTASRTGAERSRLSSLFAGLPLPIPSGGIGARQGMTMVPPAPPQRRLPLSHPPPLEASLPAAALAAAQAQAQAAATHPATAAGSLVPPTGVATASAAPGATISSAAAVQSSRAAAAATTAQVAITYITPRFLVFMRARSAEEQAAGAALDGEDGDNDGGVVSAQSVLRQAARHGLDWTNGHGIAARHVMVVSSGGAPGSIDLSALAGFPCTHAFYLTFPRHETRSAARMRFLEHAVAGSGAAAERKLDELGWRMVRYPAQLLLGGVPAATAHRQTKGPMGGRGPHIGSSSSGSTASGKLDPRALLSLARSAGLPGWDVLDESFFEPHKPAAARGLFGMVRARTRFDYALKVPPLPRYLNAVASIAASAAQIEEKLGWLIRPGSVGEEDDTAVAGAVPAAPNGVPLVPVIPFNPKLHSAPTPSSSSSSTAPAAASQSASPVAPAANTNSTPAEAADMPAFVEVKAPPLPPPVAPKPASADQPASAGGTTKSKTPRFYFYRMDERGRVWLDEEERAQQPSPALLGGLRTPSGAAGSVLRDVKALNMLLRNLRPSASLIASDPLLRRSKQTVPIPPGSFLAASAGVGAGAADATLPLSAVPAAYPWASVCAGEINFLRCEVVPVVFHALQQRRVRPAASTAAAPAAAAAAAPPPAAQPVNEHVLLYGGDCTFPFNPAALFVDTTGRLFHPSPISADGSDSAAAAGADSAATPSPSSSSPSVPASPNASNLGLVHSRLALDLSLSEAPFTRSEVDFCIRQQEETRRLSIALQEELQQRREARHPDVLNVRPDVWIGAGVKQGLQRAGLSRSLSRFVCHWQGKSFRIGIVDEEVAPSQTPAQTTTAADPFASDREASPGMWRSSRPSAR